MDARPYPDSSGLSPHVPVGRDVGPGYGWYLTVRNGGEMADLVSRYQTALRPFRYLDPAPTNRLHVTLQGVGVARDLAADDLDDLLAAVQSELASIAAPTVVFRHPVIGEEGVALAPQDPGPIVAVRALVRRATRQLWGGGRGLDEPEGFRPHLSIAYANHDGPSTPVRKALDEVHPGTAELVLDHVTLLERFPGGKWKQLGIAPLMVDAPPGAHAH